jgi:hypothetical protein
VAARLGDAISLYDGDAVVGANLALDRSRVDGEVRFAVRVPNGAIFTSVCINPGPDGGPRGWVFSQSSSASVPAAWIYQQWVRYNTGRHGLETASPDDEPPHLGRCEGERGVQLALMAWSTPHGFEKHFPLLEKIAAGRVRLAHHGPGDVPA